LSTELASAALQTAHSPETTDFDCEVFANTFYEVVGEVERAYADEIAQTPRPHREKLRVELAASPQTLQAVLNLSGLSVPQLVEAVPLLVPYALRT
jgi:hypothetical protein